MMKQSVVLAVAALLISGGIASAQAPTRDFPDAANPTATWLLLSVDRELGANGKKAPRFPAAALSASGSKGFSHPATTGQAPVTSEKIQPEMDSVGAPKPPPGAEKK